MRGRKALPRKLGALMMALALCGVVAGDCPGNRGE